MRTARDFFRRPEAAKGDFARSAGENRGYVPDVARSARRESFKSGGPGSLVPTPWPCDEFLASWDTYYREAESLCCTLLAALAESLGRRAEEAEDLHAGHISVMEAARYAAEPAEGEGPRVVCGAHRDLGTLTLIADDRPGLQLRTDDAWHDVGGGAGAGITVVAGDILARWSGHRLLACEHRVVHRAGGERLSLMFFHQPRGPCLVSPPGSLPAVTAEESRAASVRQPFHAEFFGEAYARF